MLYREAYHYLSLGLMCCLSCAMQLSTQSSRGYSACIIMKKNETVSEGLTMLHTKKMILRAIRTHVRLHKVNNVSPARGDQQQRSLT